MAKGNSVRFSELVRECGKPVVYVPFITLEKDPIFMRFVEDGRVLTLEQSSSGGGKDFGFVGYLRKKFVNYLLFPRPLRNFATQRVTAIDYSMIGDFMTGKVTSAAKSKRPQTRSNPKTPGKAKPRRK